MKKMLLLLTMFLCVGMTAMAQAPQAFNYQGVARGLSGAPVVAAPVGLQFTIHDGSTTGTILYQETQLVTTNPFGLFTALIGTGNVVLGTFSGINWGAGTRYLEVGIDPAGGTAFTSAGVNELVSVPYAVYSNTAGSANTATTAGSLTGTVTLGGDVTGTNAAATVVKLQGNSINPVTPATGQVLKWIGSAWTPASDSVNSYSAGTAMTLSGNVFSAQNTNALWNANKLEGNSVSATSPASGQVLKWIGAAWTPASDSVNMYNAGSGMSLTGSTFNAQTTTALWNANELQGNNVSATAPSAGQGLVWSGTSWTPAALPPAYSAGSGISLAGTTFSALTTSALWNANELQGNNVSPAAPSAGQGLVWSGSAWAPAALPPAYSAGSGISLAGSTFSALTTSALWNANELQGNNVSPAAPSAGQGLVWSGTSWAPAALTPAYSAGAGMALAGTTFNAQTTNPLWNANELQGNAISATTPVAGQGLVWNGTSWGPATLTTGGTVTSVTAGTGLSGGTITTSGTISMPSVGTAGTYGSATQVPVITTDAQGRVTGVTNTAISVGGSGTVTTINTAAPLAGGPITSSGTISMTTSGVSPASYGSATQVPTIAVDAWGRITGAFNTTITGTTPGGAASGDLTGSYPAPVLVATGVSAATYGSASSAPVIAVDAKGRITSASNAPIAVTMGGDVTGTNSAATVAKIQGRNVSATAPTAGQELIWNSGTSTWTPTAPSGGTLTSISTTAPLTGGPITTTGTIGLANSGVTAGTYGTATSVPTITVDALGRVTSAANTAITTGVAGTTNYIPIFTSATAIGNSIIYENPAASNRIGINYGTTNHGLIAVKATADTEAIYINQNSSPSGVPAGSSGGGYGIIREEYTGPNDNIRTGILATTIKSLSDRSGTGIEGAGNSMGVYGIAEASSTTGGTAIGVEGDSYYDGAGNYSVGLFGQASNYIAATASCYGVYGTASGGATNYAGYFQGNVKIIGSIAKTSGTFEIDHPLDPANKYLYHSFVESPDMMNIYNGNVTTDATGTAVVTLPDYFEALNKDFRYQLTVIGSFAQAMISKEVAGNTFEIKTNQPGTKVSWQVTGVRHDAWADAHRVVPVVEKEAVNKGKYLTPLEQGQPAALGIGADIRHTDKRNDPAIISHGDARQK